MKLALREKVKGSNNGRLFSVEKLFKLTFSLGFGAERAENIFINNFPFARGKAISNTFTID